jgi:endonuclease/exonuclease/phosphatase family metal-dependent hydrolase
MRKNMMTTHNGEIQDVQLVANCQVRWIHTLTNLPALVVAAFVSMVAIVVLTPSPTAGAPIKTMSFNIRFDNGSPSNATNAWISTTGTSRRDLAISVINDFGPDILGVQEALNNQVNDLKSGLPQYGFYGVGRDNGATAGEYSGIFYRSDRFTQTNHGTFWLSNTPDVPSFFPGTCCRRIASWAILEDNQAGNREYFVLNTHWDHQIQAAREHSAQLIRQRINTLAGGRPLIVMGDLNASESNVAFLDLIGSNDPGGFQLLDSYREVAPVRDRHEATFNGFTGATFGFRVDYVLHNVFFQTDDASIVRTDFSGSYPSDHYPVTALLRPIPEPSTFLLATLGLSLIAMCRRANRSTL